MNRSDKIKMLEQVFTTSDDTPLRRIAEPIQCIINLSDGTFTVFGKKLTESEFKKATKGKEVRRIINLGKGIKPTLLTVK
jgi:hypothetical protein